MTRRRDIPPHQVHDLTRAALGIVTVLERVAPTVPEFTLARKVLTDADEAIEARIAGEGPGGRL